MPGSNRDRNGGANMPRHENGRGALPRPSLLLGENHQRSRGWVSSLLFAKDHTTIPDPATSDIEAARFAHRDIASLGDREVWAEIRVVEIELARRITRRARPRLVWIDPWTTDIGWLEERLRQLRAEQRRRSHAA